LYIGVTVIAGVALEVMRLTTTSTEYAKAAAARVKVVKNVRSVPSPDRTSGVREPSPSWASEVNTASTSCCW